MRLGTLIAAVSLWTVLVGSIATADDAHLAEELKAARLALDAAFQNGDAATIKSMVTPDHLGVTSYNPGAFATDEQIANLSKFVGKYLDFSKTKVDVLGPDAAMIPFENSLSGTYDGKPLPSRVFVTEIWTRSSGKWLQNFIRKHRSPNEGTGQPGAHLAAAHSRVG